MLPPSRSFTGTHRVTAATTLGSFSILLETRDVDPFHALVLTKFKTIQVGLAHCIDRHDK